MLFAVQVKRLLVFVCTLDPALPVLLNLKHIVVVLFLCNNIQYVAFDNWWIKSHSHWFGCIKFFYTLVRLIFNLSQLFKVWLMIFDIGKHSTACGCLLEGISGREASDVASVYLFLHRCAWHPPSADTVLSISPGCKSDDLSADSCSSIAAAGHTDVVT